MKAKAHSGLLRGVAVGLPISLVLWAMLVSAALCFATHRFDVLDGQRRMLTSKVVLMGIAPPFAIERRQSVHPVGIAQK